MIIVSTIVGKKSFAFHNDFISTQFSYYIPFCLERTSITCNWTLTDTVGSYNPSSTLDFLAQQLPKISLTIIRRIWLKKKTVSRAQFLEIQIKVSLGWYLKI